MSCDLQGALVVALSLRTRPLGGRAQIPEPETGRSPLKRRLPALATVVGLVLVGSLGVAYHQFYKWKVLYDMEHAFAPGYDPALELDRSSRLMYASKSEADAEEEDDRMERPEQRLINAITAGRTSEAVGHYWLVLGEKGTGKATMFMEGIRNIDADGCAWVEAHEDPEVFRLRFGKALLFEFQEDYLGALFSRKDPRDAGPNLDVERLLNKLEKVALRYRRKHGRPAVIVFNNLHMLHNDEQGHALLHQLQQRAEAWAQAGCLTCVSILGSHDEVENASSMCFLSDDYWPYAILKKNAARMRVLAVRDLSEKDSVNFISQHRKKFHPEDSSNTEALAEEVYRLVGGRLAYLSMISRQKDMVAAAHNLIQSEKAWLQSRAPLIVDHDDDVMDQQKFASCAFLLFQDLARRGEMAVAAGQQVGDIAIPLHEACQVMTRADFLSDLDHQNITLFSGLSVNHNVHADSVLLLNAMREIVKESDFQEVLDKVRARVDEIESLHRTTELFVKGEHAGQLPIKTK